MTPLPSAPESITDRELTEPRSDFDHDGRTTPFFDGASGESFDDASGAEDMRYASGF